MSNSLRFHFSALQVSVALIVLVALSRQSIGQTCQTPTNLNSYSVYATAAYLSWAYQSSATGYVIHYQPTTSGSVATTVSTSSNYLSLTGLTPNTTYTWQVRASCSGGGSSTFSGQSTFTTTSCEQPNSLYSEGITTNSALLRWYANGDSFGNTYTLYYKPTGGVVTAVNNLTANSYRVMGLGNSTTYEWYVRKNCGATVSSVNSSTASFTTTCQVPQYPNATPGYTQAVLSWQGYGDSFTIDYKPTSATTWQTISNVQSGTTTSYVNYTLTGLSTNTAYQFRVRTNCPGGITSAYSTTAAFSTGCTQPGTPNANSYNVTASTAPVTWYPNVDPAATYELQYCTQGTSNCQSVSGIQAGALVSGQVSYTLTGLAASTIYTVRLRTNCAPGVYSAYSGTSSFTTTPCYAPTNPEVYNVLPNSATFRWNGDYRNPGGTVYELQYQPIGSGSWITASANISSTNNYLVTGLTNNTTYQWQVRAFCTPTASSSFASGSNFTTECKTPANPQTSNVTYNSAQVSWGFTSGVTYSLEWQLQGSTSGWQSTTLSSTSYIISGLNGAYTWRVRTRCPDGSFSTYTTPLSFTTACNAPSNPATDNVSSYGARLNWVSIADGARYTVEWRQAGGTWQSISDIVGTAYVLPGLTNGQAYEWRVSGLCAPSVSSPSSVTRSFTAACNTPNAYISSSFSEFNAYLININSPVIGVGYIVQWKPQSSATWDNTSPVLNELVTGGFANPISLSLKNLTPNTTYDYRVQAVCAEGTTSAYYTGQFTLNACNTNLSGSFFSSPGTTNASLSWSSVDFKYYDLRWRPVGAPDWNTATRIPGSFLSLAGLTSQTTYEWQVRALCGTQIGNFGPLQTFTTLGCTAPINLATGCIRPTAAELRWSGPIGATYELQWRPVGNPAWSTVSSLTSTAYTLSGLSDGTVYEWQVRAVCSPSQSTSFSGPISFTTQCGAPTLNPISSSRLACTSVELSWASCSGSGITYELQYKPQTSSTWTVVNTQSSSFYTITGLQAQTAYDWRVRSSCGGALSAFAVGTFTTTNTPPTMFLNTYDITNVAASLSWSDGVSAPLDLRWRTGYTQNWNPVAGQTSFYRLTGLANGTPYEWQLTNRCTNDYALITFFRTVCNIPFNPVASSVSSVSATLSWDGFGTGAAYELRWRPVGGNWTMVSNLTNATYALTGLTNNTDYEWQIRTLCSGGATSDFSHVLKFQTQCAEPIGLKVDYIGQTAAVLNWQGSGPFDLQWRPVGGVFTTVNLASIGFSGYTLTGLTSQTTYEWQVQAVCSGGVNSPITTQPLTFRTIGAAPPCLALYTIQNGDWTNPAVWSCNRVPIATDPVQLKHVVMIPDNGTGRALRVSYDAGALLRFGTGARLLLGQ